MSDSLSWDRASPALAIEPAGLDEQIGTPHKGDYEESAGSRKQIQHEPLLNSNLT